VTDPPTLADPPAGWEASGTERRTVLDIGPVEATTATTVYEDATLRDRLREATGIDRSWRFFFAGRVAVPGSSSSRALRSIVVDRAGRGFADRLADRGFEDVRRAERRSIRVGTVDADAARYEAVCPVDGIALDVDGWLAVWPDTARSRSFLLAGGAYPRRVRTAPDDGTAAALEAAFDPAAFRDDLFDLVRAVR
jgi:hypothetical protein